MCCTATTYQQTVQHTNSNNTQQPKPTVCQTEIKALRMCAFVSSSIYSWPISIIYILCMYIDESATEHITRNAATDWKIEGTTPTYHRQYDGGYKNTTSED